MKLEATHFIVLGRDEKGNAVSFAIDVKELYSELLEVITEKRADRFEVALRAFLLHLRNAAGSIGSFVKSTEPEGLDSETLARIGEAAEKLSAEIDGLGVPE